MALKMLLVKVALSDIGFVLGVTEATVLAWLRRAAQKAHEINAYLLRDLPVTQVQLDEMWNFIRRKHAQQAGPDGESSELSADGRQWVWISFAPEFRLILAAFVGPRTFESALQLIQMTARCGLGCPVLFQRWIQLLPLGTDRSLPYPEDLSTHRQAGPSQAPGEGAPRFGLWAGGQRSTKAVSRNLSIVYAAVPNA